MPPRHIARRYDTTSKRRGRRWEAPCQVVFSLKWKDQARGQRRLTWHALERWPRQNLQTHLPGFVWSVRRRPLTQSSLHEDACRACRTASFVYLVYQSRPEEHQALRNMDRARQDITQSATRSSSDSFLLVATHAAVSAFCVIITSLPIFIMKEQRPLVPVTSDHHCHAKANSSNCLLEK